MISMIYAVAAIIALAAVYGLGYYHAKEVYGPLTPPPVPPYNSRLTKPIERPTWHVTLDAHKLKEAGWDVRGTEEQTEGDPGGHITNFAQYRLEQKNRRIRENGLREMTPLPEIVNTGNIN